MRSRLGGVVGETAGATAGDSLGVAAGARRVILIIADISGYTRFMVSHQKALAHSQMIIAELLRTIISQVDDPLVVAKLEGDGILMYADKDAAISAPDLARQIGAQLGKLFAAFSAAARHLSATAICKCEACANIEQLRLKVIVHSGQALLSQFAGSTDLAGVDVIIAHRLLKNSIAADEYLLLTEAARADVALPGGFALEASEEHYPELGRLRTYVALPPVVAGASAATQFSSSTLAYDILREEIRREYAELATHPDKGFHFHTGRPLAKLLGYSDDEIDAIPPSAVESFGGTGNPFAAGAIEAGAHVVDVGCGAGFDTLLAARRVGPSGRVVGVDMTPDMVRKAQAGVRAAGFQNVRVVQGYAEALPVPGAWADVVISNGVLNLCPNKPAVLREIWRVLKPGGRIQIGDILVQRPIPEEARRDVDLWTG